MDGGAIWNSYQMKNSAVEKNGVMWVTEEDNLSLMSGVIGIIPKRDNSSAGFEIHFLMK